MAKAAPKLEWCVVRLGEDMNWWVEEISDEIHWDVDGLSIVDPRQASHIMDQIDLLRDYDFQNELLESAFYGFKIETQLDKQRLRLVRTKASLLEGEEMLFALPDIVDEEKGPYADFLDHITRLRVRMLNDSFEFEQKLTVEDLEDEIREEQNNDFLEGRAVHVFSEINSILEYVPAGYELDSDEVEDKTKDEEIEEEFLDIGEEDEKIEEDETMKWDDEDEDEEKSEEQDDSEENLNDLEDGEDEKPRSKKKK